MKGKQYSLLDKVSDNIIEIIGIEKFDDTKILLNTDDKLPDDITLRNAVILMTCDTKDNIDKIFLSTNIFRISILCYI